jgi:hypothetical protein
MARGNTTLRAVARYPKTEFSANFENITPKMAKGILDEQNTANFRRLDLPRCKPIVRDIESGHWQVNGDAIRFDTNGVLLDGQHRLMACVMADKPIMTLVVRGLDPHVQITIDRGKSRTIGDELKSRGLPYPAKLGSTLRSIWQEENGVYPPSSSQQALKPTTEELLETLEKHRPKVLMALSNAAQYFGSASSRREYFAIARIPRLSLFIYWCWKSHGKNCTDDFMGGIAYPQELGVMKTDPRMVFNLLMRKRADTTLIESPHRLETFGLAILAMNAFARGAPMKDLSLPDEFPRLKKQKK